MSEAVDDLLDRFESALTGHDRAAFADVCSVDVQYEDPLTESALVGPGALAEHVARLWGAAPDARIESSGRRLTGGRFVCAPFRLHGAHTGTAGSLPATRRRFDVQVLVYGELDAGGDRLRRLRAFFDVYDLAVQLGVLPTRGGPGEKALMVLRGFGLRARGPR